EAVCREAGMSVLVRLEESLETGRDDARVGQVVYEFKKPFRLDATPARREALEEIYRYLGDLASSEGRDRTRLMGFITDGKWGAAIAYSQIAKSFSTIDAYERPVEEADAFVPLVKTAVWFERVHRTLETRELSPENLLDD